jgi:DNA-binding protein HU-beta
MTKADLIAALAARTGASKADAARSLEALLAIFQETLAGGDDITLPGFGKFEVVETAEKQGRNPRTGEAVTIPPGKQPKFRPAAALKKLIGGEAAAA